MQLVGLSPFPGYIDNNTLQEYKSYMNAVENIMWTANTLTQRVKLCRETGERPNDLADLKAAATDLRLMASRVALTLPPGRDRSFVTVIRRQAVRAENYARRQLSSGGSLPDIA